MFYYLYSINLKSFDFVFDKFFLIHSLLLTLSFFTLEVARKIRPKELEITSRDTYTAQYGVEGASKLLIGLAAFSFALASLIILNTKNLMLQPLMVALIGLLFLVISVNKFRNDPNIQTSKKVFLWSIIYTVLLNIGMITSLWIVK